MSTSWPHVDEFRRPKTSKLVESPAHSPYHDHRHQVFAVTPAAMTLQFYFSLGSDHRQAATIVCSLMESSVRFGTLTNQESIRVSTALHEALSNAIVHGNFEISSAGRDRDDGSYEDLLAQRAHQEPYCCRRIEIVARFTPDRLSFVIRDEGPGFNVATVPDATDCDHIGRPHGRGVLMMREIMDEVRFNARGNEVILVKHRTLTPGR